MGNGRTALHLAAIHGLADVVRCIINSPMFDDVNAKDTATGQSALLWGARCGHKPVCEALLELEQCDILLQDNNGLDARALANQSGNSSVMNLITTKLVLKGHL